jgi:hypothetical protein
MPKLKIVYGIRDLKKGERRGTMTEAAINKQIKYWGLKKADLKTIHNAGKPKIKETLESLRGALAGAKGRMSRFLRLYKSETNKEKQAEHKKDYNKAFEDQKLYASKIAKLQGTKQPEIKKPEIKKPTEKHMNLSNEMKQTTENHNKFLKQMDLIKQAERIEKQVADIEQTEEQLLMQIKIYRELRDLAYEGYIQTNEDYKKKLADKYGEQIDKLYNDLNELREDQKLYTSKIAKLQGTEIKKPTEKHMNLSNQMKQTTEKHMNLSNQMKQTTENHNKLLRAVNLSNQMKQTDEKHKQIVKAWMDLINKKQEVIAEKIEKQVEKIEDTEEEIEKQFRHNIKLLENARESYFNTREDDRTPYQKEMFDKYEKIVNELHIKLKKLQGTYEEPIIKTKEELHLEELQDNLLREYSKTYTKYGEHLVLKRTKGKDDTLVHQTQSDFRLMKTKARKEIKRLEIEISEYNKKYGKILNDLKVIRENKKLIEKEANRQIQILRHKRKNSMMLDLGEF